MSEIINGSKSRKQILKIKMELVLNFNIFENTFFIKLNFKPSCSFIFIYLPNNLLIMRSILLAFVFITSITTAQVTDNFSDGDFTNNLAWSGDVSEFIVNTSKQLQLNNTVAGTSYLSTSSPASSLNNTEWRFFIKQSFAPSTLNYGRVYLASNQANLEGSSNGYYLQFGEAGSTDSIELFRQTGTTSTFIMGGANSQIANPFAIGVKVTRNASGLWSLYVDASGGSAYSFEVSATDNTFATTSFFGVVAVYTSSNATKFYFDDFYVGPIVVDITPPSIVSSTVISSTQVDVLFSESVDLATSQTLTNYSANNGLGAPSIALRDAINFSLVHLTFATAFTNALSNTLTVHNVKDFAGNAIITATTNFTYFAPITPAFKDIVINEIFADPSHQIALPSAEFVEIYNRSTNAFNLNGWKYTDGTSTATLGNYSLAPNHYLILCAIADTALYMPYGVTMGLGSWPSLNNSGDNLKLMNNSLAVIDSVNYSDTWYQDATKKAGGWTLELINPNVNSNCPASSNWIASNNVNGGTPGAQNTVFSMVADVTPPTISSVTVIDLTHITVCFSEALDASQISVLTNFHINPGIGTPATDTANNTLTCVNLRLSTPLVSSTTYTFTLTNLSDCSGNALSPATTTFLAYSVNPSDIIINEIMANPDTVLGLPDFEYVELYNKTTFPINLNNWTFTIGTSVKTFPNITILADSFLVLTSTAALPDFASTIATVGFPSFSLANLGQTLTLQNPQGAVISTVSYTDQWYQDANKKLGGWALELINPNASSGCPASSNWIASTNASGGSPGIQNSVYSTAVDVTPPTLLGVSSIDSTYITVCFSEAIDSSVLATVTNFSINNSIGVPVSAIPNGTFTCVDLILATHLTSSTQYTISFSNIADCSGNTLGSNVSNFIYYKIKPFDMVINEIMANPNPSVGLPNFEYVELHNRTTFAINLKGWKFSAGTTARILPDITIAGNGYLTLTSTIAATQFASSANAHPVTSFPVLTNSGQILTLKTPQGGIVSTVSYSDQWYQDANKINGGWSLEQIDPNNPCAGTDNWRASVNPIGGTPGAINSINASHSDNIPPQALRVAIIATDTIRLYFNEPLDSTTMLIPPIYSINNGIGTPTQVRPIAPDFKSVRLALSTALQTGVLYTITVSNAITDCVGNSIGTGSITNFALPEAATSNDIVINEILSDPKAGGVDFVEIYNLSNKVIDLKTLVLSEYDTINKVPINSKIISADGYLFFPKEYLVLSANGSAIKSQYNTTNPEGFWDVPSMITMNAASGTVCLSASTTNIIDLLKYSDKMQFPLLTVTKGVSLERIDFNRPTQDPANWHSAAQDVGFATPAYKNSQFNDAGETDNAIEITPEIFSPDEDGYNDIVNINYHFDTPGFVANITIYDSKGRLVKSLIRNELLGMKGTFSWDGINGDREKSRLGIYIIFAEVFDLTGQVKQYKKTCVLGGKI